MRRWPDGIAIPAARRRAHWRHHLRARRRRQPSFVTVVVGHRACGRPQRRAATPTPLSAEQLLSVSSPVKGPDDPVWEPDGSHISFLGSLRRPGRHLVGQPHGGDRRRAGARRAAEPGIDYTAGQHPLWSPKRRLSSRTSRPRVAMRRRSGSGRHGTERGAAHAYGRRHLFHVLGAGRHAHRAVRRSIRQPGHLRRVGARSGRCSG